MAEEMTIRGTQDEVKIRSPWAAALLPFITLGIYHFVWWYRINRELRDYGYAKEQDLGQNPTNSLLALIPGALIIVPPLVSYWRGFHRVQKASELAGQEQPNGWIALLLYVIIAPAFWAYVQVTLNDVWRQDADALAGTAAPPAPEGAAPAAPEAPPPPAPEGPPPPGQEGPAGQPPAQEPPA
jgi:hypothetical protein